VAVDRNELERLRAIEAKVKSALAQTGDDVCWRDLYNPEVAALVGVGVEFDPQLLPRPRFLGNCGYFYDCLAAGTPYATPDGDPDSLADAVIEAMGRLPDDRARETFYNQLFSAWCRHCGGGDQPCYCTRDD
jgi:hypothetical protein